MFRFGFASNRPLGADRELSDYEVTLRRVRPATMNNTKVWALLCVGMGLEVLALHAWDSQIFIYAWQAADVPQTPFNSRAWAALGMSALFSGMTLLMLANRKAKRLAHLYPANNLVMLPPPGNGRAHGPKDRKLRTGVRVP